VHYPALVSASLTDARCASLKGRNIGDEGAVALAEALRGNTTVTRLK
jgi:hypothetical protein